MNEKCLAARPLVFGKASNPIVIVRRETGWRDYNAPDGVRVGPTVRFGDETMFRGTRISEIYVLHGPHYAHLPRWILVP